MNKYPDELHRSASFERAPAPLKSSAKVRSSAPRRRIHPAWGLLAVAVLAGLGWYLFGRSTPKPKTQPPAPVHIATAEQKSVTVLEHTIGTVVSVATVQVTSRVEGQLLSAGFKEGDIVHKGDLLFQLDPRPFQAALAQAIATQSKDQAQLVSAHNDAVRYTALQAQGAVSKSQTDQFVANSKALGASVAADKANVDTARLNLIYAQIRSPIDGKTGPILVQPGNIIPENGTAPLVTITQIHPIKVSFALPQNDVPQIQTQMAANAMFATVTTQGAGGSALQAKVDFVGNQVNASTGTIELRATYDNADNRLVPGQMVDVGVALRTIPNAIVVPSNAVNIGPAGNFVYVVDAKSEAKQQTATLLYDDGTHAAIKADMKAGQRVITDGQLRVVDGAQVNILKGAAPAVQKTPVGAQ